MNSIINGLKSFKLAFGVAAFAVVLVGSLAVSVAPAQAQFDDFGDVGGFDSGFGDMGGWGGDFGDMGGWDSGFDGGYTGGDWSGWSDFGDTGACDWACDGGYTGGDWSGWSDFGDTGYCEGCGYDDYSYDDYSYDDYDYDYDYADYDYDYDEDYGYDNDYGYSGGGYSGGGYSGGGYSGGGSYSGGSYYSPSYTYNYPSYRYPVQQPDYNHCVNNSCNTNVNTRIDIREAQPYVAYQQPIYPVYNQYDVCVNLPGIQTTAPIGYYTHAGHCVVATNYQQPYISLSSVPYTGLELGPVGTALYWGFLVLWCLLAAYLIAVKKVQNKIVAGLNSFLFPAPATASHAHSHTPAKHVDTVVSAAKHGDEIDSFIQSQINRSR